MFRFGIRPLAAAGSMLVLVACSAAPDASQEEQHAVAEATEPLVLASITASEALSRAEEWVTAMVPYCQSANHQPDPDTACPATCTRPDNPAWDAYRSDCSGFLSWAWGLPAPGRTTFELAPAVTDITQVIDPMTLEPGDAVNKPHDHTMLFVAWITPGTRATFMEEPGCSSATPYAHQLDSDVTISGMNITVADNGITFNAIRYDGLVQDDAGAPPPADAGTPAHDGGGTPSGDAGGSPPPAVDAGGTTPPTPAGDSGALANPDAGSSPSGVTPGAGSGWDANGTSGCSASPARGGGGAALFALALAPLLARRRRRR
jgi:hypothetical protein